MIRSPLRAPAIPISRLAAAREDQTGCHEPLDVAVIGQKAVHELAHGIDEQHGRADQSQLCGVERAAVKDRLLDHVERRAADVIEAVAEQGGDQHLQAQLLVITLPDVLIIGVKDGAGRLFLK